MHLVLLSSTGFPASPRSVNVTQRSGRIRFVLLPSLLLTKGPGSRGSVCKSNKGEGSRDRGEGQRAGRLTPPPQAGRRGGGQEPRQRGRGGPVCIVSTSDHGKSGRLLATASPPGAGEYAPLQSRSREQLVPLHLPRESHWRKICCSELFQQAGHKGESNSPRPPKQKPLVLCHYLLDAEQIRKAPSQLLMLDLARLLAAFLALFPGP